jgi:hypothetical protein
MGIVIKHPAHARVRQCLTVVLEFNDTPVRLGGGALGKEPEGKEGEKEKKRSVFRGHRHADHSSDAVSRRVSIKSDTKRWVIL